MPQKTDRKFNNCRELKKKSANKKRDRIIRAEQEEGRCVFIALLAGAYGLPDAPSTCQGVLKSLRNRLQDKHLSDVTFCDRFLTLQEQAECKLALPNIHVGDGYYCAALDPLLLISAAVFHINIIHKYMGNVFEFCVSNPRRSVYLTSSVGHMEHTTNRDHVSMTSKKKTQMIDAVR